MGRFYKKLAVLLVLVLSLSAAAFGLVFFGIHGTYDNNYQKGFVYQYRALQKADADVPKIMVIGGSYMTFSVDSSQLGKETGMPSYTLGIHGGMGMCYILETAEKFINEGDIVVMPFSPFTENDYGMDLIYLSLDSEPDMFWDFFKKHPEQVVKSAGAAVYTKVYGLQEYIRYRGGGINSVYDARAFDPDTGNLVYKRTKCIADHKDLYEEKAYRLSDIDDSCYKKLNEFAEFCKRKGATLYLTHAPAFQGAVISSDEEISAYQKALEEKLQAPFLSDLKGVFMPKEYMYDGAMHMNDTGKRYYTHKLYEDLCRYEDFGE